VTPATTIEKREAEKHPVFSPDTGPPGPADHGFAPEVLDIEIGHRVGSRYPGGAGRGRHVIEIVDADRHDVVQHPEEIALIMIDQFEQ